MADEVQSGSDAGTNDIGILTSRVLTAWRKRLRRMKDARPRGGDRGESERHLVSALLRVTEAGDDHWLPALAAAAARYGTEQPRARLDPSGLCNEFAALRQIVLKQLPEAGLAGPDAASARIHRLDQAIAIVAKAAVSADTESQRTSNSVAAPQTDGLLS
jgi:hypothetical protein